MIFLNIEKNKFKEIIRYLEREEIVSIFENEIVETNNRNKLKDTLEIDLAKSNLEANELNKKIAKQNAKNEKKNRITTWINIGIGIINVGLLIWQIIKSE